MGKKPSRRKDRGRAARRPARKKVRRPIDPRLARLGVVFKEARERRGLAQREIAAAIGKSIPTVCDYEQGRRELGALTLFALSDFLRLSPNQLAKAAMTEAT